MSSSRSLSRPLSRRTFLTTMGATATALSAGAIATVSGCSHESHSQDHLVVSPKGDSDTIDVIGDDPTGVTTSSAFLHSAHVAVVTGPHADLPTRARACNLAASAGVPVFLMEATNTDNSRKKIESELNRLGVDTIVTIKGDSPGNLLSQTTPHETTPDAWPHDVGTGTYSFHNLIAIPPATTNDDTSGQPTGEGEHHRTSKAAGHSTLPTTSDGSPYRPRPRAIAPWNPQSKSHKEPNSHGLVLGAPSTSLASFTNASIAGRHVLRLPAADPRATHESIEAVKKVNHIIALGSLFGDKDTLSRRIDKARQIDKEQLGGGGIVTPGRHIVALYGSTDGPDLGCLGEQDKAASVARAKNIAKQYEAFTSQPVIPAFEIIVTIASSAPEKNHSYSRLVNPTTVEPWIDAINSAGGYAIIDLQPGRMTLLNQAKKYERLLKKPYVGLALDPEWRLFGNEKPMEKIGHVDAHEINDVVSWLDTLIENNHLPQKPLVVHQFKMNMIHHRERMITGTDNVDMVIHIDGNGTQSIKMDTWHVIQQDLDPAISVGWKNFYDEDKPMLTPRATMAIQPQPNFISYQ